MVNKDYRQNYYASQFTRVCPERLSIRAVAQCVWLFRNHDAPWQQQHTYR